MKQDNSVRIAELNDAARSNAVNYVATRGIMALAPQVISEIFMKVQEFDGFTEDNDPYGEHDFGCFEAGGKKAFWKIDYYDQSMGYWCDPLRPECKRVVTILLAEEY